MPEPDNRLVKLSLWIIASVIIVFLLGCFLTGCAPARVVAMKPYTIVEKTYIYSDRNRNAEYVFVDANGRHFMFYEDAALYEKGEVIY